MAQTKTGAKTSKTTKAKPSSAKKAQNPFADALPQFKDMETLMKNNPFQFDQFTQSAANQSREGMEAFVKSGEIFAKGFESMIKTAATLTQSAAEKQAEFAKELMGSKTFNEFTQAQNKIVQENFDQFMAGATQLSEMGVKVLNEASEPINAQMTKAMNEANKTMAA